MLARIFLDDQRRVRLGWRLAIFVLGVLTVHIVAGIGAFLIVLAIVAARGEPLGLGPEGEAGFREDWMLPLTIAAAPFIAGGTAILAVAMRAGLDRRSIASMGLIVPARRLPPLVAWGLLVGAAPIVTAAGLLLVIGAFHFRGLGGGWLMLPLLAALVLMAFSEEIVFRGYMLQNFLDARRPVLGVALTSILFWLAHSLNPAAWTSPWNSINLFAAGIALALAYLASGELWFPTAMHFGWNAAQGVLFNVPISGLTTPGWIRIERSGEHPDWLTGGEFGLEGSAVTSALLAITIAILFAFVRRRGVREAAHLPPRDGGARP